MRFKAILLPIQGERAEQTFCMSLEEAKKWARRTLWACHRKAVQTTGPGLRDTDPPYSGPRVVVTEMKPVGVVTVYPWEVTDEDKKQESAD